jgi:hypothetical protein
MWNWGYVSGKLDVNILNKEKQTKFFTKGNNINNTICVTYLQFKTTDKNWEQFDSNSICS